MFLSINTLPNHIVSDKPDTKGAQALQEGLGGQFGEMRTMMQYLFQNMDFRGDAKSYLYEVSNNKALRSIVSYLVVRDLAHEKVFAKALETLRVSWGRAFPVPKLDSSRMPEVKELDNRNLHNQSWTFSNENLGLANILNGPSPFGDGEHTIRSK